jgi:acetyl esterase/lipase
VTDVKPAPGRFWATCGCLALTVVTALPLGACLTIALVPHRASLATDPNVVYGNTGGQDLLLDVYRPLPDKQNGSAVILIHGGGWQSGSKEDMAVFGDYLSRAGFVAFSVNYRLATRHSNKYPVQLADVQLAVRWVRAHADDFGIDPGRVGAFGHSAGGHLAALLGTTENQAIRVDCVVDTCGPTDFTDKDHPPVGPTLKWLVPNLFGKTFDEAPELYRDASPIAHVSPRSCPFLIIHGTNDELVPIEQSIRLHSALKRAGVESTLLSIEGEGHLFEKPDNQKRWIDESIGFFERHLNR